MKSNKVSCEIPRSATSAKLSASPGVWPGKDGGTEEEEEYIRAFSFCPPVQILIPSPGVWPGEDGGEEKEEDLRVILSFCLPLPSTRGV
jgi:hypothetical protein